MKTLVLTPSGEWVEDQSAPDGTPYGRAPHTVDGNGTHDTPPRPQDARTPAPRTLADYHAEQKEMRSNRARAGGAAKLAKYGAAGMREQARAQAENMTPQERAERSAKGWATRRSKQH